MATNNTELNILITVTNQAKATVSQVLSDLAQIQKALAGINSGSSLSTATSNLSNLGFAATSASNAAKGAASGFGALGTTITGMGATANTALNGFTKLGTGVQSLINSAKSSATAIGTMTNALSGTSTSANAAYGNFNHLAQGLQSVITASRSSAAAMGQAATAANTAGASANTAGTAAQRAAQGFAAATPAVKNFGNAANGSGGGVETLSKQVNSLVENLKFLAGGFLALKSVSFLKDLADTAARTETLGIVLRTVGQNAGYTAAQIDDIDAKVQKLGITAAASRQALAQMVQANIPLDFGEKLARAAQDLAVISGKNSSETFSQLITNIQQGDTEGLRYMGIILDKEAALAKAFELTGNAIGKQDEAIVVANAVLAEAAKVTGIYENALNSAGKAAQSLPRYIENLKVTLGNNLLPVYLAAIKATMEIFTALNSLAKSFNGAGEASKLFGQQFGDSSEELGAFAQAITNTGHAIAEFIGFLEKNPVILETVKYVGLLVGGLLALKTVVFAIGAAFSAAWSILSTLGTAVSAAYAAFEILAVILTGVLSPLLATVAAATAVVGILGAASYAIYRYFKGGADDAEAGSKRQVAAINSTTDAVNGYLTKLKEQAALQAQISEQANKVRDANIRRDLNKDPAKQEQLDADSKAAEEELKRLQAIQKEKKAELDRYVDYLRKHEKELTAEQAKEIESAQKAAAAVVASVQKKQKALDDLKQALKDLGSDFGAFSTGVSSDFAKKLGEARLVIMDIGKEFGNVGNNLKNALLILEEQGKGVKTPEELEKYKDTLEEMAAKAQTFGADFTIPLTAALQAAKESVAANELTLSVGGPAALANLKKDLANLNTAREEAISHFTTLTQIANDAMLDYEKDRYDKGLVLLTDYNRAQEKAERERAENERAAIAAKMDYLQQQLRLETSEGGRAALLQEITSQYNKLEEVDAKYQAGRQKRERETNNLILSLRKEIAGIQAELLEMTGREEEALLARANAQLKEQEQKYHQLGDAAVDAFLREKAQLEFNTKLMQIREQKLQKQIDLANTMLDLQDAILAGQQNRGEVNDLDAQQRANDLIVQRIRNTEKLIDQARVMEQFYRSNGMVEQANDQLGKIAQLQIGIESLNNSVRTLGKEFKNTFTDELANGLDAALGKTKTFAEAMKDAFKAMAANAQKVIAKDLAQDITKLFDGIGKGEDGKGKGLFDGLAELLTGKPSDSRKVPDGTAANPLNVQVANFPKLAGNDNAGNQLPVKTDAAPLGIAQIPGGSKPQDPKEMAAIEGLATLPKVVQDIAKPSPVLSSEAAASVDPSFAPGATVRNAEFDYDTANGLIGRTNKPIDIPSFDSAFDEAAKKYGLGQYGLDSDMLRFIALKESGMNPAAESPYAKGLMQFTPDTFKGLGYNLNDIKDPLVSIDAGANLLSKLLKQYDGDVNLALAAYNAGPRVANAMRDGVTTPQSDANRKQTEDYVAVLGKLGTAGEKYASTSELLAAAQNKQTDAVKESGAGTQAFTGQIKYGTDVAKANTDATVTDTQVAQSHTEEMKRLNSAAGDAVEGTKGIALSAKDLGTATGVAGDSLLVVGASSDGAADSLYRQSIASDEAVASTGGMGTAADTAATDVGGLATSASTTGDALDSLIVKLGETGDVASAGDIDAIKKLASAAVDKSGSLTGAGIATPKTTFMDDLLGTLGKTGATLLGGKIGSEIGGKYGPLIGSIIGRQFAKIDLKDVGGFFSKLQGTINNGFGSTGEAAGSQGGGFFSSLGNLFSNGFSSTSGTTSSQGGGFFSSLGNLFSGGFKNTGATATAEGGGFFSSLGSLFSTGFSSLFSMLGSLWNGFTSIFSSGGALSGVGSALSSVGSALGLTGQGGLLSSIGSALGIGGAAAGAGGITAAGSASGAVVGASIATPVVTVTELGAAGAALEGGAAATTAAAGELGAATAGLAAIPGAGWVALGALAVGALLMNSGGSDTEYGGQYKYNAMSGQVQRLETSVSGTLAETQVTNALAENAKLLNDLLAKFGSDKRVTEFTGGLQSSNDHDGYAEASGTLSDGTQFGRSGGVNYSNQAYLDTLKLVMETDEYGNPVMVPDNPYDQSDWATSHQASHYEDANGNVVDPASPYQFLDSASPEEAAAAYAEELQRAVLLGLKASNLSGQIADYLNSLGSIDALTRDQVVVAYANANQLANGMPMYAEGGMVTGPGTGTSDSITAQLSNGEFVVPAKQTRRFLPLLEGMRKGLLDGSVFERLSSRMAGSLSIDIPRAAAYAGGGLVSSNIVVGNGRSGKPIQVTQNIYTPDANSFRKSKDQTASALADATRLAVKRNR